VHEHKEVHEDGRTRLVISVDRRGLGQFELLNQR
jgi:hypothetical protein